VGRRAVLLAGLAVFVVAGIACAVTRSLYVLIAMRGLQGIGACAGVVVARAMIRDVFEHGDGTRNQSLLSLASNLGTLLGPLAGGVLVTAAGFRAVYAVLPVVGAVLLAACARWVPETWRAVAAGRPRAGYRHLLADRRVMGPVILNGLAFAGMFACIAASPQLLLGGFAVTPTGLGVFFALVALASLAGSWLNHALLARFSPAALSSLGLALVGLAAAALVVAASAAPSLYLVAAAMTGHVLACGIVMPNAIAVAMVPLPRSAGTVAAVIGCAQAAFGAAAAALVAIAPRSLGGLAAVVAGFSLLAIAVGARNTRRSR
jgi:DHA1 family bicyclomycin/chloramphenicol resistance-like MFS transporter